MKLRAEVCFRDSGEAARWLARYYSQEHHNPAAIEALREEFPYEALYEAGVGWEAIERVALDLLATRRPVTPGHRRILPGGNARPLFGLRRLVPAPEVVPVGVFLLACCTALVALALLVLA